MDLNDGEKELMNLWNIHVIDQPVVADRHIKLSLFEFIEKFAAEVRQKVLGRNFILHVCNMHDFGLLSASEAFEVIVRMQKAIVADAGGDESMPHSIDPRSTEAVEPEITEIAPSIKRKQLPEDEASHVTDHESGLPEADLLSDPHRAVGSGNKKRQLGEEDAATPEKDIDDGDKMSEDLAQAEEDEEESLHLHLTDSEEDAGKVKDYGFTRMLVQFKSDCPQFFKALPTF